MLLFCVCTPAIKYFILLLQFGIWVSGPRQTDRRDLGFRTSTDGQTGSGFQDLDRRTVGIWVSRPQQTDRRDLGFRTSTDGQSGSGFQDLDRRTDGIWVSGPGQTDGHSSHGRGSAGELKCRTVVSWTHGRSEFIYTSAYPLIASTN